MSAEALAPPRLVVVTGASQGIGEAVALAFADRWGADRQGADRQGADRQGADRQGADRQGADRQGADRQGAGARVALVARSAERLASVADACRARGAEARPFACDVTDDAAVDAMAEAVVAWGGAPAVLVNNAGAFEPGGLLATSAEAFRRQIEVNLTSAFLVTRALVPAMTAAGTGRIVFLGSVASVQGYPGGTAYGAAKHGVLGLARSLREELRDAGIAVTTLLPGATRTPSWDGAGVPDDRLMPADDIARLCVDVSDLSPRTVVEELLVRPHLGDL